MNETLQEHFFDPQLQFGFEKNFDEPGFLEWIRQNWTQSFWYSGFYVAFIFGGKLYMESRPRFEIRSSLFLWSFILAVFSIFGAVRTLPELIDAIRFDGMEYSLCNPSYFKGPTAFWAFMFTISKVYELGDTLFIVLRKQQLIFLHWYHHISVLIYVWYSYTDHTAPGRWFMVMNYTVHAIMYTYYALRALRIRMPKVISMIVTTLQLSQMVWGLVVCIWAYMIKNSGRYCSQSYINLLFGTSMYFSYFLLFGYFFYNAYVNKNSEKFSKMSSKANKKVKTHPHQE